nr:reverse transcriptase domain-containing protein [Tanacetum cinerariifolium]
MLERHESPTPHDAMLTRWRSRVASRSSSPTTSTPDIPTSPILPAPYTIIVDSSTPPRFVNPPFARTPRCSEAYLCWRSASLSTMYPTTTFESLARDSSSESSTGPSRKRCRSHTTTVTSSIHATRALVPSRADLLPPRNRFKDSISPEDSVEEEIDTNVLEDIEANATDVEVAVGRDVVAGVDAGIDMEYDVGVDVEDKVESSDRGIIEVRVDVVSRIDIPDGMLMPDVVECLEQVGDAQLTGHEIIHETIEKIIKIKKCIQATRDRQKSYADRIHKPLEFDVGDKVMLK